MHPVVRRGSFVFLSLIDAKLGARGHRLRPSPAVSGLGGLGPLF